MDAFVGRELDGAAVQGRVARIVEPAQPLDDHHAAVLLVELPAGRRIEAAPHRARLAGRARDHDLGRHQGVRLRRRPAHLLVERDRARAVGQHDERQLERSPLRPSRRSTSVPVAKRAALSGRGRKAARGTAKRSRSGATAASPRQCADRERRRVAARTPDAGPTISISTGGSGSRRTSCGVRRTGRGATKRRREGQASAGGGWLEARPGDRRRGAAARSAASSGTSGAAPCGGGRSRASRASPFIAASCGEGLAARGRQARRRRDRPAERARRQRIGQQGWRHETPQQLRRASPSARACRLARSARSQASLSPTVGPCAAPAAHQQAEMRRRATERAAATSTAHRRVRARPAPTMPAAPGRRRSVSTRTAPAAASSG